MSSISIKDNPEVINLEYTDRMLSRHFALVEDHLLNLHAYLAALERGDEKTAAQYQQCLSCIYWHLEKIQAYNDMERVKFAPECSKEDCLKASIWAAHLQERLPLLTPGEALEMAKQAREFRYYFAGDKARLPEVGTALFRISDLYRVEAKKEEPPGPGLTGVVPWELSKFKVETRLVRSKGWDPSLEVSIRSPRDAVEAARKLEGSDRERLLIFYLNTKNNVIGVQQLVIGSRDSALVPSDAIIRSALLVNAAGLIMVHNHPSGVADFSIDDMTTAKRIKQAAQLFDMELLDFIVLGEGGKYVSLRERGEL